MFSGQWTINRLLGGEGNLMQSIAIGLSSPPTKGIWKCKEEIVSIQPFTFPESYLIEYLGNDAQ